MIHFDFEDRYQDEAVVGQALSWGSDAFLSMLVHAVVIVALLFGPRMLQMTKSAEELEQERQQQMLEEARRAENRTFVFVQPRIEMTAPPKPRAELSDVDRRSQQPTPAPAPQNPLPFSRGNSTERTESQEQARKTPEPPQPQPEEPPQQPKREEQIARNLPQSETGLPRQIDPTGRKGSLAEIFGVDKLQKYVQNQTFENPQGGVNDPGSQIQFDTKGVEFGPWIRRFVAQVRRNWNIPDAALAFRGHVVLRFNIHKDGRITDLVVLTPAGIEGFTIAALNAIRGSNPTFPLPPEYPDEKALFTVTFYYNEQPGS